MPLNAPRRFATLRNIVLFALFFGSGCASLIYQIVWLRLAFAHFGVVTPVLSVVISVFMLGLGVGSLLAGRWWNVLATRLGVGPNILYGLAELIIALGAIAVPVLFALGETLLLRVGLADSGAYLVLSALVIVVTMLPWCIMMGATYPLMMAYVRARDASDITGFSLLYLANVVGAMSGTLLSAVVLIEKFGFTATSRIAALMNIAIALVGFLLPRVSPMPVDAARGVANAMLAVPGAGWKLLILFVTGFCSLAMEVVWARACTINLGTTIYAFAGILTSYLLATWIGSALYRRALRRQRVAGDGVLLFLAGATGLLPVVLNDPLVHAMIVVLAGQPTLPIRGMVILASIVPLCVTLGYLTPKLIDDLSQGEPRQVGRCYAVNILGGILGPLVAGYLMVPRMDVSVALIVLAVPMTLMAVVAMWRAAPTGRVGRAVVYLALPVLALTGSRSYEAFITDTEISEIRRDHVATAIAVGTGMDKRLLVNGYGITSLTPLTKIMAHLPIAVHGNARDVLVICFGMGTTLRSAASWNVDVTSVDLTRSVIESFAFFHADASSVKARPNVHLVADDGRRFLMRTERMFDVIILDPPPPVEAAGSSLLYSTGFYAAAKRRLREGGIVQQWLPDAGPDTFASVRGALRASFPHVVVLRSIEGKGHHFLASMRPIVMPNAEALAARMAPDARRDLLEWGPAPTIEAMSQAILAGVLSPTALAAADRAAPVITDDRAFNEYFLLRRLGL